MASSSDITGEEIEGRRSFTLINYCGCKEEVTTFYELG